MSSPVDRRGVNHLDRHGVIDCGLPHHGDGFIVRQPSTERSSSTMFSLIRSIQMYSMYEALARERMREQREQAQRQRLSRDVASARRWQRLAAFSARRAARTRRQLAEHSASDYQLAA